MLQLRQTPDSRAVDSLVSHVGDNDFFPVHRGVLSRDSLLSFDIYVRMGPRYVLYRAKNLPFDSQAIQKLINANTGTVFIRQPDLAAFNMYAEQHLPEILRSPDVPGEQKASALYISACNLVQVVFESPTEPDVIKRAEKLVEATVQHILSDPQAASAISRITSHDYYTYTHCVDVCAYAVALANFCGDFSEEQIYNLGVGAILHDLGKSQIPTEILNKAGELTEAEHEVMKRHPQTGVSLLRETHLVSEMAYLPVLQHHERIDGTGYPSGLSKDQISILAKITSIVDCYDAMTTRRPYRRALSPLETARIMRRDLANWFDPRLLLIFIMFLGTIEAKASSESMLASSGPPGHRRQWRSEDQPAHIA